MSRSLEACAARLHLLFGAGVECDVVPVNGDPADLWPAESECVAAAVLSRRREFAAGRACARRLLARLGFEPAALLAAKDRSPLWPSGAIGSIAHDEQLCAVAVAHADRVAGIGLDVEPDAPLEEELWPELFLASELDRLAACPHHARGNMARVYFSAKECVYKCTYAHVGATLGFRDVEILLAPGSCRFRALVHHPAGAALSDVVLEGFHLACAGSILTGMSLATAALLPSRRPAAALSST